MTELAPDPMLRCEGLRKKYGDRQAVDGVSFFIGERECYGLLGPNGAGKTTTISMLCGLTVADEGEVSVAGFEGGTLEAKAAIGFVPQDLALYPDLSAVENLTFFGQLYGLSGKELQARIGETLDLVGLADRGKDRIGTYSGGMKRRANMAAGLLHRPKLLVLDEPTVGVDPQSRNAILETVGRLGVAVLYTTHYMEEASKLCDRIGIIDDGRLIAEGTADSLIGVHGGRDKVHLACDAAALDELAAACRELDGIHDVHEVDGHLELTTDHGPAILSAVVAVAIAARHRSDRCRGALAQPRRRLLATHGERAARLIGVIASDELRRRLRDRSVQIGRRAHVGLVVSAQEANKRFPTGVKTQTDGEERGHCPDWWSPFIYDGTAMPRLKSICSSASAIGKIQAGNSGNVKALFTTRHGP